MKALQFANKWYRGYLPKTLGSEFQRFAAHAASLVEPIAIAPVKVDRTSSCAYTDGTTISIPGLYFMPEYYQELGVENPYDKPAAAITCINGSMIHEALHISLSICNMENMVAHDDRAKLLLKSSEGFRTILGLVEDLFIENFGKNMFKRLNNFVVGKNEIIFSFSEFEKRLKTFSEEPTQSSLINVMLSRKNTLLDRESAWEQFRAFAEAFDKAKDITLKTVDRVTLALEIYDMFENEEQQAETGFSPDEDFDQSSPDESEGTEGESEILQAIAKQLLKELEGEIEEAASLFERQIKLDNMTPYERLLERLDYVPALKYEDILDNHVGYGVPEISKDFSNFAKSFRYMYEEKHTLGRPNDTGTKIVKQRLHRILTDQKVLAYHDRQSVVRGKPKVIILMDASASTTHTVWPAEKKAAFGAFKSLQQAGISTAVYAHTSFEKYDSSTPGVFGIAAHNMPLGKSQKILSHVNYSRRFSAAASISLSENYDGFAIDFVSSCFPTNPGTNILVVMSDGVPSGYNYRDEPAIDHTIAAIKKARNNGVKVIVVSLVSHVFDANSRIYGQEFNVPAWDGKLEKSLQSIMVSLLHK